MSSNPSGAMGRRQFLAGAGIMAAAAISVPLKNALAAAPTRTLSLEQLHTKERIEATYMADGRFDDDALDRLDRFLRDWRTGDVMPIDRNLFDMLYILSQQLPSKRPIVVVSGYRTVKTNEMLRRSGRGAAKNSFHTHGMAVDFRLPGVKTSAVRRHAMALEVGGVGYYPDSGFVHIDTGPIRYW